MSAAYAVLIRVVTLCALPLLASAQAVAADALRYSIEGAPRDARDNIRAFLGPPPRDQEGAERFLATARQRAGEALEALGFYDYLIDVAVDRAARPWEVTLRVDHGDPVTFDEVLVELQGAGVEDAVLQGLVERLAPRVGSRLHHGEYEALKSALQRAARERGYFDASFQRQRVLVDAAAGTATLDLSFATGERLRFGPATAPEELIAATRLAALLPFREGDPYLESGLAELRERLLHLGFFDSVIVTPAPDRVEAGHIPISVDLLPAPRHSYELGVGFSTDTRERVSLSWHSPQLNRWGHSQQTRLRYSPVNPAARITYSMPMDARANDLLQLRLRLEDNEFGDLNSAQRELQLRREQRRGERVRSLSLSALDEDWTLFDVNGEAAFLLLGGSWSRRGHRGNVVDPDSGFSVYGELKAGSSALASDQDLIRGYGNITALRRFGDRSRVVGRVAAGILEADSLSPLGLPPSLAFFAGGDNSIRGFAYQSIGRELTPPPGSERTVPIVVGGSRMLTGSIEYQHYLLEKWRAAVFVDGGDAFVDDAFDWKVAAGFGVHYLSPLGALRFELARPTRGGDSDWRIHINIGAEF